MKANVIHDTHPAGRYWGSADTASLSTDEEGGALMRLSWNDGKYVTVYQALASPFSERQRPDHAP